MSQRISAVHCPEENRVGPLGYGEIITRRVIAHHEQLLFHSYSTGERVWLPAQHIKGIKSPEELHNADEWYNTAAHPAERFRLRQLALALKHWDRQTGASLNLNIEPLPHQLHLVHRIISSGDFNWMIADDVGLGKTVEVGLLITAMRARRYRRFLIVCPPSVVGQWRNELHSKFNLGEAAIYGEDFNITHPDQWRGKDIVITSMDKIKQENHLQILQRADRWEMAIFDEAHRLTRYDQGDGSGEQSSQRYQMANKIRQELADSLLLVSGTPHQGNADQFKHLLKLLRPTDSWPERINNLEIDPSFLGEMIIRNRKADVMHRDGTYIFQQKRTSQFCSEISEPEKEFQKQLVNYLKKGYKVIHKTGFHAGTGLVMTTYRKLASSSTAAITHALEKRLARLKGEAPPKAQWEKLLEASYQSQDEDDNFVESEELQNGSSTEFFEEELEMLNRLVETARSLKHTDSKMGTLINDILPEIDSQEPGAKILIFTEYRSTQHRIVEELERLHEGSVAQINGSQNGKQREEAVKSFNDPQSSTRFLVSTEAGGEGINMHEACHFMINYDMPWNPMRLVQRTGRIYRYGQRQIVNVFNLFSKGNTDEEVLLTMNFKLEQIAKDMAHVSDEYSNGLTEDILGSLASLTDIKEILNTPPESAERTQERVDRALAQAKAAAKNQLDLLNNATSFDKDALKLEMNLTPEHLKSFVMGMCKHKKIQTELQHAGEVLHITMNRESRREFIGRQHYQFAFTKEDSIKHHVPQLTMTHKLMQWLFEAATDPLDSGMVACIKLNGVTHACAELEWQDQIGRPARQDFVHIEIADDGYEQNTPAFISWLLEPAKKGNTSAIYTNIPTGEDIESIMELQLQEGCSPERGLFPSCIKISGIAVSS